MFVCHIVDQQGISADPEKTAAVREMRASTIVSELRRFLGRANQLGKFSYNLTELSQPLRELLNTKQSWLWGPVQNLAFQQVKEELAKPTIPALYYDPTLDPKILHVADSSSFDLEAVILQKSASDQWRAVAFTSHSLTNAECRYAQIEKEPPAIIWACEKFQDYILSKKLRSLLKPNTSL